MSQLQSAGSGSVHVLIEEEHTPRPLSWRKLMRFAGPGLLMCIAYVVRHTAASASAPVHREQDRAAQEQQAEPQTLATRQKADQAAQTVGGGARCSALSSALYPLLTPRTQDPGNLESDLQAGAATGYTLLWLLGTTTLMVRDAWLSLCTGPPSSSAVSVQRVQSVCHSVRNDRECVCVCVCVYRDFWCRCRQRG